MKIVIVSQRYHTTLANYFLGQPIFLDEAKRKKSNRRKLIELPWQLIQCKNWEESYHLYQDREFFRLYWIHNKAEFKTYWSILERNSSFTVKEAYKSIIQAPNKYIPQNVSHYIAQLLMDTGCSNEARKIFEILVDAPIYLTLNRYRIDLLNDYANSLIYTGEIIKAHEQLEKAELLLINDKDKYRIIPVILNHSKLLRDNGLFEQAEEKLRQAEITLSKFEDRTYKADTLIHKASLYCEIGEIHKAKDLCHDIEKNHSLSPEQLSTLLFIWGKTFYYQGSFDQALGFINKAIEIDRRLGERRSLGLMLLVKAEIENKVSSRDDTLLSIEEAEKIFRDINDKISIAKCKISKITSLENELNIDERIKHYEKARTTFKHSNSNLDLINLLNIMALDYLKHSMFEEAYIIANECEQLCRSNGYLIGLQAILSTLATLFKSNNDFTKSLQCLNEKIQICQSIGKQDSLLIAYGNKANIHFALKEYDKAIAALEEKVTLCIKYGYIKSLCHSYGNLGAYYVKLNHNEKARFYLNKQEMISREYGYSEQLFLSLYNQSLILYESRQYKLLKLKLLEAVSITSKTNIYPELRSHLIDIINSTPLIR